MNKIFFFVLLFAVLVSSSCDDEPPITIIPYAFVNLDLNLNQIKNQDLRRLGGYIYIEPGNDSGYKGIIIYHEGNGIYRAFERACSFDPRTACDPIVMDDSGLFMIHNCCNSLFNFNGNPMGGPATSDLLQYQTYLDGIYLKIINK